MLAPARYIADFARFVARKGPQEHDDAQPLAELHGCSVYGSSSLVRLMHAHGIAERAVAIEP